MLEGISFIYRYFEHIFTTFMWFYFCLWILELVYIAWMETPHMLLDR